MKEAATRPYWEEHAGQWMGHTIASASDVRGSAFFSKFETDALRLMIEREPLGADAALDRDLTRALDALDAKAGRDGYVLAITADHGMPAEPAAPGRRQYNDDVIQMIHEKFDPRKGALARFLQAQPFVFAAYTEDEVARVAARMR